ncbi:ATP synthase subunit [Sporodiniella umbellata]|nr:ATP synthase subunit [Sporodiniella umbellata]
MSTARPLNDDEVFSEMKKMVAFIKQEAIEKAREIKSKADEDFNIEKAKIVRQESVAIDTIFERKMKQAQVQKKIAQSNHINKSRLKILHERQAVLDDLFEDVAQRVQDVSKSKKKYNPLIKSLILQGALAMMEPEVVIYCREQDLARINSALNTVADKYEEITKTKVQFKISDEHLPSSSAGGVVLKGLDGKITVDNTLDARLDIVKEEMLPQIRVALFDHSPNRTFFN